MTGIKEKTIRPAQFLVENIDLLPKGKVLDVAMGSGGNAVYLARKGFEVEGVDISAEAVNKALDLAQNFGVLLKTRVGDLEGNYTIEINSYDVIICFKYLQRSLIQQIREGLRTSGMVVYETFIVDQVQFGKPKNPDHLLKHNELLDFFRDFRCLRFREGIFERRKAIASIIAQKT
jgi:2-polyprenyl-3-methyl-5-hydroxy-6-metoxy-1,4-benzoquinol methylase